MKAENMMKTIASLLLLLVPVVSQAQSCNSTGADKEYKPAASGAFDPVALGLNAAGDNVFNFTSVTIPSGVTITMPAHLMKSQRPVVFLVSGAVNINGTLDLSGAPGNASSLQFENRTPSEPGAGGYPGGVGAMPNSPPTSPGAGPGGGKVTTNQGNGCDASYTYPGGGGGGCKIPSPVYGNQELLPLVGGSGGSGGGSSDPNYTGASGGAGGGAIRICSDTSISIYQLYANGGYGGNASGQQGVGGGGSGGAIHLQAPTVTISPYGNGISAIGGYDYYTNGRASTGRVRIDSNSLSGSNNVSPAPFLSSLLPGNYDGVPLPTPPTVTVVSINGVTKKSNGVPIDTQPLNMYSPADLTFSAPATGVVPVVVNTTGIPSGTKVTFYLYVATDDNVSPGTPDIAVQATVTSNTATLNIPSLPAGVNRLFVRAVF